MVCWSVLPCLPPDAAGEGEVCSVCCLRRVEVTLARCGHQFCSTCLQIAFTCSLDEGRGQLHCLKCSRAVWPHEVADVVPALFPRYLDFSLRKYLASSGHARYCPAPDCEYACLWEDESGCGEPLFQCRHEACGRQFCYECKRPWHEGNSCQEAKRQQGSGSTQPENPLTGSVLRGLNLRECPACAAAVEKVKDNTCNMVDCGQCGAQFCWLCGRPVSELHFFRCHPPLCGLCICRVVTSGPNRSPTGCGMYGQRQWSPKELWCLRVWIWALGAPLVLAGSLLLAPVVMVAFHVFLVWEVGAGTHTHTLSERALPPAGVLCQLLLPAAPGRAAVLCSDGGCAECPGRPAGGAAVAAAGPSAGAGLHLHPHPSAPAPHKDLLQNSTTLTFYLHCMTVCVPCIHVPCTSL